MTFTIDRRRFIGGAMALTTFRALEIPQLRAQEAPYKLDLRLGRAALLEEGGPETAIWGYNGQVPGPLLKAKRGERLKVICTDPGALNDIPAWCRINGHRIVSKHQGEYTVEIVVEIGNSSS